MVFVLLDGQDKVMTIYSEPSPAAAASSRG